MKFFKLLIILIILLQSCDTIKYSLVEKDMPFNCSYDICSKGIILGELDIKVDYSKMRIKNKNISMEGTVRIIEYNCKLPYCGIYLGKEIAEDKILLKKKIAFTKEEDGSFKFKANFDKGDYIVFYGVSYIAKLYRLEISPANPAVKTKKTD